MIEFTKEQLLACIDKHFPYPSFNKGQREAIAFAVLNLAAGKKHVIMELPTGLGKSIIATTVHKVLKELHDDSWRTSIITTTHGLQEQYVLEDKKIFSIKGKTNYSCSFLPKTSYNDPGCQQIINSGKCVPKVNCDYVKKRDYFLKVADLRLTNSAFFVSAPPDMISATVPDRTYSDLLIIDECHSIDETIINNAVRVFDIEEIKKSSTAIGLKLVQVMAEFVTFFSEFEVGDCLETNQFRDKATDTHSKVVALASGLEEELKSHPKDEAKLMHCLSYLKEMISMFDFFVTPGVNGTWILEECVYTQRVKLIPLYAHQVAKRGLFSKSNQFLHISATICGVEEYKKTLGIEKEDCAYLEMPNPIPVDNRKIYQLNALKVSGAIDYKKMAEIVDRIVSKHTSAGHNGVIHTVSFKLSEDLRMNCETKRKMKISNKRDEILSWLKEPKGRVILSPSIETGYDFKDDISRFQIIAKVPFEYLGSKYVEENKRRSPKWYARRAILRIVQASGRSIRGPSDWATTYIIDSNFEMLLCNNRELFPSWYLDSLA